MHKNSPFLLLKFIFSGEGAHCVPSIRPLYSQYTSGSATTVIETEHNFVTSNEGYNDVIPVWATQEIVPFGSI